MEISITWNICRVCLAEEEKTPQNVADVAEPMRSIFNEEAILAKQIYECSGIAIKPNDNLPEKICKKCYTLLNYAVNFRDTCRASDTYLQNILQRTKSASALLKKQQTPSETLKKIMSNDCLSVDNNDGDPNVTLDKSKRKMESHPGKTSKRFKDSSDYSDLIEFESEDEFINENGSKNSVVENILDHTGPCVNEDVVTVKQDDDKYADTEIILQLNTSQEEEDQQLNEESQESEDFKQNNDDPLPANSEKEDDYSVESYEQLEEFIVHKGENPRDITSDMEFESEDSQAKVSSTVAVLEDGIEITELEADDTEYIINEYILDDNSRDNISLENASLLYVQKKKVRSGVKTYQTHQTHKKRNTDFKVYVCDLCGNHFGNRQLLNAHIKVHRQEKNHECEICFKRFITACNLQAHMRIHTGEKPFECKYCGRRFSDRSSNLRHERTHTNERPFQCKICGKAFSLATTLQKHLKVHSGERSFKCDICEKSFKLPHQLKAHKNTTLHKAVEKLAQIGQ